MDMCQCGLCIFMTILNVLTNPEQIIKIYAKIKRLCHFNHTLIKRKHKNESFSCIRDNFFKYFYCIKIAISLDVIKIY